VDRRVLVLCAVLVFAPPARGVEPGVPAPECSFPATGGAPPTELSGFRGHVVWVDFWASWCDPCVASIPFLNQLDQDLHERGLRVLGVNLDERPAAAAEFLAQHPVRFLQVADPEGHCPQRFGVDAMPSSYLVDRRGVVRHVHRGFRAGDAATLRRRVEALLAETPDDLPAPAEPGAQSPRDAGD